MSLWPQWIDALRVAEPQLRLITPLLQLAEDGASLERQDKLAMERRPLGLRMVPEQDIPLRAKGGLLSEQDGRVEPLTLVRALLSSMTPHQVQLVPVEVRALCRTGRSTSERWRVETSDTESGVYDAVVICSALQSGDLLTPLGHERGMAPVLGQAVELQLKDGPECWAGWPAVLVSHGFNLIPTEPGRLLLGATVEPGDQRSSDPLDLMKRLDGTAPQWLSNASTIQHWSGLRARPVDRPAPLLEELEPGLLLATGHYRNGILLAPATAEWVVQQLKPQ
jgi:glycine oxidase